MISLVKLLLLGSISHVHLICDHDPDGETVSHWFNVSIELPQNNHVQTLEFTVNYGPDEDRCRFLDEILASVDMWYPHDRILEAHQGYGYEGFTQMKESVL